MIMSAGYIISFLISYVFLSLYVYSEAKVFWKDTFSYFYGLSNTLFIILIIQIAEFGDFEYVIFLIFRTRIASWKVIAGIYLVVMVYILPLCIIREVCKNVFFNRNYLEKLAIIILCFVYVLISNMLYNFFKGYDYSLFSLGFENQIEFIVLISIIFTSLFSGYSSIQCIFNYLIHPYVLGVNTVDALKHFLSFKTMELIVFYHPDLDSFAEHSKKNVVHANSHTINSNKRRLHWAEDMSSVSHRIGKKEIIKPEKLIPITSAIQKAVCNEEYEEPLENINLQETFINTIPNVLLYIFNRSIKNIYNYMICKGEKSKSLIEVSEIRKFSYLFSKSFKDYKDRKTKEFIRSFSNLMQKLKNIFNWILFYFFGKILGFYSLYKVLMTIKNYFLSDYRDINIMLNEEMINIIDKLLNLSYAILRFDHESLVYNILEQYFSLLLVGILLLVNMRSFLNTIHFLYTRAIKKFYATNTYLETLLMTYFLGMFYATSCFFIIFSLPKTYR